LSFLYFCAQNDWVIFFESHDSMGWF
jgi:hypothetical protein